jgi:hypothetical protein
VTNLRDDVTVVSRRRTAEPACLLRCVHTRWGVRLPSGQGAYGRGSAGCSSGGGG